MARCNSCEYQLVCDFSPHLLGLSNGGQKLFSSNSEAKIKCTPINEISPFVNVVGTVREPKFVKQWPSFEKEYLEFFLDMDSNGWIAVILKKDDPELPSGFEHGAKIRIRRGII